MASNSSAAVTVEAAVVVEEEAAAKKWNNAPAPRPPLAPSSNPAPPKIAPNPNLPSARKSILRKTIFLFKIDLPSACRSGCAGHHRPAQPDLPIKVNHAPYNETAPERK